MSVPSISDSLRMAEAFPEKFGRCLNCDFESTNETDFLNHVRIHQYEKDFKIPCFFCPQVLRTFQLHKKHKKTCKGKSALKKPDLKKVPDSFWVCLNCFERIKICNDGNINDFDLIIKHLNSHSRSGEIVECPVCQLSYKVYKSFNKHIVKHKTRKEISINLEENSERTSMNIESDTDVQSLAGTVSDLNLELDVNPEIISEINNLPLSQVSESVTANELFHLNSIIAKNEALFALKLSSKYLLPREVVSDIFSFYRDSHSLKMEFITSKLNQTYLEEENLKINHVTETIDLIDHVAGLKENLLTHFKREKILSSHFEFIQPKKVIIGRKKNELCFYYSLPVQRTLSRLMKDDSIREFLIHMPIFEKQSVSDCNHTNTNLSEGSP